MSMRLPLQNIVDETNNSIINKTDILFIISIQNVDLKVFDIIFKELIKIGKKEDHQLIKIYHRKTIKSEQEHKIYYGDTKKEVKTNYESLYFSNSPFDSLVNYKIDLYQKHKMSDKTNITSSSAEISVRREFVFEVPVKGFTWIITLTVYYQQALVLDSSTKQKLKDIKTHLGSGDDSFDDFVIYMNSKKLNVRYKIDIKLSEFIQFTLNDVKNVIEYLKNLINPNHSEDIIKTNILKNIAKYTKPYVLKNPSRISLKTILPAVSTLNRSVFDQIKSLDGYFVTEKADGERAILYIDNKIIALVSSKLKMDFKPSKKIQKKASVTMIEKTIIDGEYVDGVFYGFDIIYLQNKNVMSQLFPERVKLLSQGIEIANEMGVSAVAKTYHVLDESNKKKIIKDLIKPDKHPYKIDGLIFTNPNESYGESKHYKWKPAENNTIDFLIVKIKPDLIDFSKFDEEFNPKLVQYFLFTGVNNDIFNRYGLQYCKHYDEIFKEKPKNYFPVQFSPSTKKYAYLYQGKDGFDRLIGEFLLKNDKWELIKIRDDRQNNFIAGNYFGNDYKTAESVWMNYFDPLELKDLWLGTSGVYFTNTKNNDHIYQTSIINAAKRATIKQFAYSKIILDIGVGKGQDLNKYLEENVKHLIAIDLDKAALVELVRRKHETTIKSNMRVDVMKVDINEKYHENITKIQRAFDVTKIPIIICNLAVHYFLKNDKSADNFINFIDHMIEPGGSLVLTFMDGDRVHEVLKDVSFGKTFDVKQTKSSSPKYSIKKMYKDSSLGVTFGKEIGVLLPFSNDEYYTEYVVNTKLLVEKFASRNIILVESKPIISITSEFESKFPRKAALREKADDVWLSLFQELIFTKK